MVDTKELRIQMLRAECDRDTLAKELGISTKTLSSRFKKGVFGSDEIEKMISFLGIEDPMSIFFAKIVSLKDTE